MTNLILDRILNYSKETKTIIAFRKYNAGDSLYVGYVVDYDDSFVIFQHVTLYGLEDGLIIEKITNIETFEAEDDYVRSYQFLVSNHSKIEGQTIKEIRIPASENWQYELKAQKAQQVVG